MPTETKTCQNCNAEFKIFPEDLAFYARMGVPAPTFCWECRLQRRMAFRNERSLYKRKCDAPGHDEMLISLFSPEKQVRAYDHAAWWGDSWDPMVYGKDIDFTRPFLLQVSELWKEVPDIAVLNINPVNSDYCSITEGNKNCYLVIGGDFNENIAYSTFTFNTKESLDTYWVSKSELNYETIDCVQCSRLTFSRYCEGCYDSALLFNCKNSHHCFGCVNLTNKSYCMWNEQLTKEEYERRMQEIDFGSYEGLKKLREQFATFRLKFPRRFARTLRTVNSIGDNLEEAKNCYYAFDVFGGAEDSRYIWLAYSNVKDCMDCDHFGQKSELGYEVSTIYPGNNIALSKFIFSAHDVQYSYNCHNVSNLFGCVGLRNKQYCILNKHYTKEEYEELMPKLKEQMQTMPYADAKGRKYAYGEFFPAELSPFAYNETAAQELFPLSKEEALAQGFAWRDPEERKHHVTLAPEKLPDHIKETNDAVLEETLGCLHGGTCNEQCTTAFKLIPSELAFYKRFNLPLPRLCPNCRHYARTRERNPLKLWERSCQCAGAGSDGALYTNLAAHVHGATHCPNTFQTSYGPKRAEIVYCESCYQAEVA